MLPPAMLSMTRAQLGTSSSGHARECRALPLGDTCPGCNCPLQAWVGYLIDTEEQDCMAIGNKVGRSVGLLCWPLLHAASTQDMAAVSYACSAWALADWICRPLLRHSAVPRWRPAASSCQL